MKYLIEIAELPFRNFEYYWSSFYDSFISLNWQLVVINYFMIFFEMIVMIYKSDNVIKPWIDNWLGVYGSLLYEGSG